MANPQSLQVKQSLAEVEFCLNKYLSENFTPIITREYDILAKKQSDEYIKHLSSTTTMMSNAMSPGAALGNAMALRHTGEWNTKDSEWLLNQVRSQFFKNPSFKKDLETIAEIYRYLFIQQLGEEQYKRISKDLPSKDLAFEYIGSRMDELFIDKLAKKDVPQSSLDYVFKKGFSESFVGWLLSGPSSVTQDKISARVTELYNPSTSERFAAKGVTLATDVLSTGGVGSSAAVVKSVSIAVVGEVAASLLVSAEDSHEFSHAIGEVVFNDKNSFIDIQKDAKKISPSSSRIVRAVNSELSKKMELPSHKPVWNPFEQQQMSNLLKKASAGSGSMMFSNVTKVFSEHKISVDKDKAVPDWMLSRNQQDNYDSAAYWTSTALEMKKKNKTEITIKGKKYSYEEVCQRGYDFARASSPVSPQIEKASQQQFSQANASVQVASSLSSSIESSPQGQDSQSVMANPQTTYQPQAKQAVQPSSPLNGWDSLMSNQFGMSNFGEMKENMGYILAMLPDMLVGMFTGKSRNLKFKDNIFPIAAIMMGLFMKRNPLLKMLLIGFGGMLLFKKASSEILEDAGVKHNEPKQYRQYDDERLDPRLKNVAMKGNTMLADIDGKPMVLTISQSAVDAYYKGKLPLNTLANAVLQKYDMQQSELSLAFERGIGNNEDQQRNIGIK